MKRFISQLIVLVSIAFLAASCQRAPFITMNTPGSFTFTRDGGSQSITFSCNRPWSVTTSESWIQVSPSSGAEGGEAVTVKLTCAANTTYDPRSATVTIKVDELTQTVSVNQETGLGLIVSPTTLELTNAAQTIEIEVQKNVQYTVAIDDASAAWIKQGGTKALTTDKITFTIVANTSYDNREGKIVFKQLDGNLTQTVTIRQSQTNGLFITTPEYNLSNEAHTLSVEVKANVEFAVTSQADWITYVETKALKASTIVLSIPANESYDNRTGTVLVKQTNGDLSGIITVNQKQTDYLTVTPTSFSVSNQAQTAEIEVKDNVSYSVVIPDDAKSWISVSSNTQTKALTDDKVTLSIAQNTTYDDREASVTIKQVDGSLAGTVKITQAYGEGLIPEKTIYDIGQEGGSIEVAVQANVEYEVTPEVDWIHIVETKALTGSTITLTVDENNLYSAREGKVLFKKKEGALSSIITVKQAQKIAVTSVVLDKTEIVIKSGESATITAKISPTDATVQSVTWLSSDESIAIIDDKGNVTGIKRGRATISAIAEDKEETCLVYVDCVPDNQIRYTMRNGQYSERNGQLIALSAYNQPYTSNDVSSFFGSGVSVVSHSIVNGEGIVIFNKPIEVILRHTDGILYYMDRDRLTSLVLPDSITEIPEGAFSLCTALKSVHLPANLKKLSNNAFGNCALTTIEIPENVVEIGDNPFRACGQLESFAGKYVSADKRCIIINGNLKSFAFNGYEGTSYSVPDGVTVIGSSAFMLNNGNHICPNITSIILPSSVTKIEKNAFEFSRKVESIDLPSGLTEIGYAAFYNCAKLKELVIPDTVTRIAEWAFAYCSSLTEITIPDGVSAIGSYTFPGCSNLKTITLPASLTTIGGNVTPGLFFTGDVFEGCSSLTKCFIKANIPPSVIGSSFPSSIQNIFVPTTSVNEYKTAEWWKEYAGKIQGYDF